MDRRPSPARAAGALLVLAAALSLSACAPEPTPYVTVTVSTTETVTADPGPGGVVQDVIEDAIDSATEIVMPDVVGMNLQDAQDLLQSMGSYFMDQEDASGDDRLQIDDSNWNVCKQDPEPGETLSLVDVVTLASVKVDESCP